MKKIYCKIVVAMVAIIVSAPLTAHAQDGFTRKIEIEKEFSAAVDQADRIEMEPRLLDTTIVRPTMKYSIKSTAHQSDFGVDAISPIEISTARWNVPTDFYLNAGMGMPLKSELDIFWTPIRERGRRLNLYLLHNGVEGKVENLDGERRAALRLDNYLGGDLVARLADSSMLRSSFGYKGAIANPYGGVNVLADNRGKTIFANALEGDVALSGRLSRKANLDYTASLGGDFALLSNYGIDGGRQADGSALMGSYRGDFELLGLDSVKLWLPRKVSARVNGAHWHGYSQGSVTVDAKWAFRVLKHLPLSVSIGYDLPIMGPKVGFVEGLVGELNAAWERDKRLIPYITALAQREDNMVYNNIFAAPYANFVPTDARKLYDVSLGVKGELKKKLNYNLRGGLRLYSDYLYVVAIEGSPLLDYAIESGVMQCYAEAQMLYTPINHLTFEANITYVHFLKQGVGNVAIGAIGVRPLEGGVNAKWDLNSRWSVALGGRYAMACNYTLRTLDGLVRSDMQMPDFVELTAKVEWRVTDTMTAWLCGDNLLNQPIYYQPTYIQTGIGARGGVSIVF